MNLLDKSQENFNENLILKVFLDIMILFFLF